MKSDGRGRASSQTAIVLRPPHCKEATGERVLGLHDEVPLLLVEEHGPNKGLAMR